MSDERIHRHDWQQGRCKLCGVQQREAESELPPARGWKHEPMTSEQAKQILKTLKGIKTRCGWILWFVIFIWLKTLWLK